MEEVPGSLRVNSRVHETRSEEFASVPICDSLKLVFVHVPKNAGTAVEKSCAMRATGHKPWFVYQKSFPEEWKQYQSFGIIRDPVDRFISCYRYARMERSYWHSSVPGESAVYGRHPDFDVASKCSFSEFVEKVIRREIRLMHPGWLPQSHWLCNGTTIMVDRIIRYSNLTAELNEIGVVDLLRQNVSSGSDGLVVSAEHRRIIEAIYRIDFDSFGTF